MLLEAMPSIRGDGDYFCNGDSFCNELILKSFDFMIIFATIPNVVQLMVIINIVINIVIDKMADLKRR